MTDSQPNSPPSTKVRNLVIAGLAMVCVVVLVRNAGPWVGSWTVDASRLADDVNGQLTNAGLPAIVPTGFGARKAVGFLGLDDVHVVLEADETWSGQLSSKLGMTPASGTWVADGDDILLNRENGRQPPIEGRREGRTLLLQIRIQMLGRDMEIPFSR